MADLTQDKGLKNTLAQIKKDFGEGAIMQLGDNWTQDVQGISSGSLSIDIALGGKGFPRGRVCEIFGPEASGKTTVALHTVAEAQKLGGVAAFIDAEHALDPSWAKRIRVKVVKNKIAPPFRVAEVDLMHDRGIARDADVLDLGVEEEIVQKSGGY